jgi:hypothetical protein
MSVQDTIVYIQKLHPQKIEKFKNLDIQKEFTKSKLLQSISLDINSFKSTHCEKSMVRMLIECQRRLYLEDLQKICYNKLKDERTRDKFWRKEYYKSMTKIKLLKNRKFLKYESQLRIIIPLKDFIDYEKYNINYLCL